MRTKLGYAVSALLSFLLCAVMLCGAVLPTVAEEAELPSLNYSNPNVNASNNKTLSANELYLALLDREPTDGEKLYWQGSDLSLTYTDKIPDSSIDTEYNSETEILNVTVAPYIYTAANGAVVAWIPKSISLEVNGTWEQHLLTEQNGVYIAQIGGCVYSGNFGMKATYTCEIAIERSVVQTLLTEAYNEGSAAWELMQEYLEEKAAYDMLVNENLLYDQYKKQKEDYDNYIKEKAKYDELLKAYQDYDRENKEYLALVEAEQAWVNYYRQQDEYKANIGPYTDYLTYYNSYKAAVDKLAMFEAIFKAETRGWSMYGDIMGSAVTEVLSKQDLLVAGGADAADVHLAGVATENLRVLLKGYNDLRTAKYKSDHEKYKALYEYYTVHYDALKQNFCDLYKTLKGLYGNTIVSDYIALKEKTEHYRQLVGHLFIISRALDQDKHIPDNEFSIDRKSIRDVIQDVHYFPDGDWDPKNTAYPAVEVAYVKEVVAPVLPTVARPVKVPANPPKEVQHPGEEPMKVEAPQGDPPQQPPSVPENAPIEPKFSEAVVALYEEVRDGKFSDLENYYVPETVSLKLTKEIEGTFSVDNRKLVTFLDGYGNLYYQEYVNYGETIYLIAGPVKNDTPEFTYKFQRWTYDDGSELNSNLKITVTKSVSLQPKYNETRRTYTITFNVENQWGAPQSKTVTRAYGTKLSPDQFVTIPSASNFYRYEFSGWYNSNGELVDEIIVTGEAIYTGSIQRTPKSFDITWVIREKNETVTEQWKYQEIPAFSGDTSIPSTTYIYTFLGWDKIISEVTGNVTYTALYSKVPYATCGDTVLEVVNGDAEITVEPTGMSVDVKQAALLAAQEGKTLIVRWNGVLSVSLAGEELQAYINADAPALTLRVSQEGNAEVYEFEYLVPDFATTELPSADIQFVYSNTDDQETWFEIQTAQGWQRFENGQMTTTGNFKVRRLFAYSIVCVPDNHCDVRQENMIKSALAGEWVSIALECDLGYKVVGATILTAEGETISVSGVSFQMPASAVTITLKVEQIVYRVIFRVDGVNWKTYEYHATDKIVLPENPTKASENGYAYTFIGWGDVPPLAIGDDEELIFDATFSMAQIATDYDTGNNNNVVFSIVLPCVLAAVALLVIFLVLNRIVRKKGGWKVVSAKVISRIRVFFQEIKEKIFNKKDINTKNTQDANTQAPKSANVQAPKTVSPQAPKATRAQAPKSASAQAPKSASAQAPKVTSAQAPKSASAQALKSESTQQTPKK